MKLTVVINVPAHLVVSVFVGLLLWATTGDGEWAYAYTCGAIFPILIQAFWPDQRQDREP